MDKSTPLSHLRRDAVGPDDEQGASQMMDNIVDDIEQGQYSPEEIEEMQRQAAAQRYPQPMPGMMPHQRPSPQQQQQPHPGMVYRGGGPMMRGPGDLENLPFMQKLMLEAGEPLLVAVLVVILSSGQVHSLINRFVPMAQGNHLIGLLIRAVIAGLAFYLLRRFIPT